MRVIDFEILFYMTNKDNWRRIRTAWNDRLLMEEFSIQRFLKATFP